MCHSSKSPGFFWDPKLKGGFGFPMGPWRFQGGLNNTLYPGIYTGPNLDLFLFGDFFYGLYHGISSFFTTIWEHMFFSLKHLKQIELLGLFS